MTNKEMTELLEARVIELEDALDSLTNSCKELRDNTKMLFLAINGIRYYYATLRDRAENPALQIESPGG